MTIDKAINVLAERTHENKKDLERKNLQRRNSVVDIYGERQYVNSPGSAYFYVSISKDLVYMERFQFKLIFSGLAIPIDTAASGVTTSENLITDGQTISPNPHSHGIIYDMSGVTVAPLTGKVTGVYITGSDNNLINITAALDAQYGSNSWRNNLTDGMVYPSEDLDNSFDIMQVACDIGKPEIISSGLKRVLVTTSAPCNITLLNYLKYSHLNR